MSRISWVALLGLTLLAVWLLRPVPDAPAGADKSEAAIHARMCQVLGRDDILPIYQPRFVAASRARYRDDELVLGVSIQGHSKGYDISTLNAREIVVDQLAGMPILVTW